MAIHGRLDVSVLLLVEMSVLIAAVVEGFDIGMIIEGI
jgi:hypothetical protein